MTSVMDRGSPKSSSNHMQASCVTSAGTICVSRGETHSYVLMKVKRNKIQCRDSFHRLTGSSIYLLPTDKIFIQLETRMA